MKHLLTVGLSALVGLAVVPPGSALATSSSPGDLFGPGPHLYLSPDYGAVGTRVSAIGWGYGPATQVRVRIGPPNAEYMPQPVLRATVGRDGTFRATLVVSCRFIQFTTKPSPSCAPRIQPLILAAMAIDRSGNKRTATTAFIVTY